MRKSYKGVTTVFLSLVTVLFLTFCLVLAEGARMYFLRARAEQAAELAEFSALSEYRRELLEEYGLFFLDLDYGQPKEQSAALHQRVGNYLAENAAGISTQSLNVRQFVRATDGGGSPFFEQAAAQMRAQSGLDLAEEILSGISFDGNEINVEQETADKKAEAEGILAGLTDEEGKPLFELTLPNVSFPSVGALTDAVFGKEAVLSEKSFSQEERIGARHLQKGAGGASEKSFLDMQMFQAYALAHCAYYGNDRPRNEALEYQVEYMIAGEDSDRENLENIMWRIFLLRAAGNYAMYHRDAAKMAEAEGKAAAVAAVTGNAALIGAVRELCLLADAIDDGIGETRDIFRGEKLPVFQNGILSEFKIGYREYLYLFLQTTGTEEKIIRCMDVAEMEIRTFPGSENFRFDHCTDCFQVDWTYRFESLFLDIPFLEGTVYQNKLQRKMYYEM